MLEKTLLPYKMSRILRGSRYGSPSGSTASDSRWELHAALALPSRHKLPSAVSRCLSIACRCCMTYPLSLFYVPRNKEPVVRPARFLTGHHRGRGAGQPSPIRPRGPPPAVSSAMPALRRSSSVARLPGVCMQAVRVLPPPRAPPPAEQRHSKTRKLSSSCVAPPLLKGGCWTAYGTRGHASGSAPPIGVGIPGSCNVTTHVVRVLEDKLKIS